MDRAKKAAATPEEVAAAAALKQDTASRARLAVLKNIPLHFFLPALDAAMGGDGPTPPAAVPAGVAKMYVNSRGQATVRQPGEAGGMCPPRPRVLGFGPLLEADARLDGIDELVEIPMDMVVEAWHEPDAGPRSIVLDRPAPDFHAPPEWGYLRWMGPGQLDAMAAHLESVPIQYDRVVRWDIETARVLSGKTVRPEHGAVVAACVKPVFRWDHVRRVVAFLRLDEAKYAVGVTQAAADLLHPSRTPGNPDPKAAAEPRAGPR